MLIFGKISNIVMLLLDGKKPNRQKLVRNSYNQFATKTRVVKHFGTKP